MAALQLENWMKIQPQKTTLVGIGLLVLTTVLNVPEHLSLVRGDPRVSDVMISQGEKVASWVNNNTKADDYLYNWGVEWEVYSGAARRSPTRQVNALLIVMAAVATSNGAPVAATLKKMQQEVIDGFKAHPPEVFVLTAGLKNYDIENFFLPSYIETMLIEDYTLVFEEKPYWVFRRKPDSLQAGSL